MDKHCRSMVYSIVYRLQCIVPAAGKTYAFSSKSSQFVFRCNHNCNSMETTNSFFGKGRCFYKALAKNLFTGIKYVSRISDS